MADAQMSERENKPYFQYILYKFRGKRSNDSIKKCKLSLHENIFVELKDDSSLNIEYIHNEKAQSACTAFRDIYSFVVADKEGSIRPDVSDEFQLTVTTVDHHLRTYTVTPDTSCKLADISFADLGLEVSLTDVSVVYQRASHLLLSINNYQLLLVTLTDGQFKAGAHIDLTGSDIRHYHIVDDKLATLDILQGTLSLYRLEDLGEIVHVDLTSLNNDLTATQTWCLSADLCLLALVQHSGDILLVDLARYTYHHPHCLRVRAPGVSNQPGTKNMSVQGHVTQQQTTVYLQTCEYGDLPWRDRLADLHVRHINEPAQSKSSLLAKSPSTLKQQQQRKRLPRHKTKGVVTGFKAGQDVSGIEETEDQSITYVQAPADVRGYSVDYLSLEARQVCLVYSYNNLHVLAMLNLTSDTWSSVRLRDGERVLLSQTSCVPHLVVTDTQIVAMVTDSSMNQEQLVSELMMYGGASLADAVCHLNEWGTCSLPLNTLEVGLKHRQLDTVTYFLKSKQNFFSSTSSTSHGKGAPKVSHLNLLVQLEPALQLLLETVRCTTGDKHSPIFGKQVLDLTMEFLYDLLLDGLSVMESSSISEVKADIQLATEGILSHIEDARCCVRSLHQQTNTSSIDNGTLQGSATSLGQDLPDGTSQTADDLVAIQTVTEQNHSSTILSIQQSWGQLQTEEIIEDGILRNMIPEMQQYLQCREPHPKADYSELTMLGRKLAIDHIKTKQIEKAKDILFRLGLDVDRELWEQALHTTDITLCTSITEELSVHSSLTLEQVAIVTFMKELNELYPCRNFEVQKSLHHHVKDCETHEVQRLKNLVHQECKHDLVPHCGNLATEEVINEDVVGGMTTGYNEVIMAWAGNWDTTTRDTLKLDVLLHATGSNLDVFSRDIIWEYLLSRNMVDVCVAWINNSFHGNQTADDACWPVSSLGSIPVTLVNNTHLCTQRCRHAILKAFARYGVFTDAAWSNFDVLLDQVSCIGGPLQIPHPLATCGTQRLKQFHLHMAQWCVTRNLPYLLWEYSTLHRLSLELLHLALEDQTSPWLPLFLSFYAITLNADNMKEVLHASSRMNAALVWGEATSSVGELIKGGHSLAAMATLMYSPHKLHQVTFVTQQLDVFDGLCSETVERALAAFPKLQVSLFPARASDQPLSDVSVYQLLNGNAPFDPAKLFGWQTTNTCFGQEGQKVLPYFSHPELTTQLGYSEHIRYTYYLKQGRPVYAFITFLAEEFKNGGPTIQSKRLSVAIGTSLWIGIKHFYNSQIASTCAVFQELLGHDSGLLRTYIEVGGEILAHRDHAVTGTMDKRREQLKINQQHVVEMMLSSVQCGGSERQEVKQSLEAAILAKITRDRLSLCSVEAGERWSLAVQFCRLLGVAYSTEFLESCAQSNLWLPFIWFSQLHQYPKDQLVSLVHKFRSSPLQEHLRYVLGNAELRSSCQPDGEQPGKTRKRQDSRLMRSNLYKKIGVMSSTETDVSSTSDEEENNGLLGVSMATTEDGLLDNTDLVINMDASPDDVFGVIFAAQSSTFPWKSLLTYSVLLRNCLFAELAACHQGAELLPCLCGWLVSMMEVTEHAHFLENYGKSPWRYNMQVLDDIINVFIKQKWASVLVTAFDIFQQNSPLVPFLQFYAEFTEKQNFHTCRLLLDEFKESIFQFNHERGSQLIQMVGSSGWLEQTTFRLLQHLLTSTSSVYHVSQLLNILDAESITLVFKNVDADFRKQSQMLACVDGAGIPTVDLAALLGPAGDEFEAECASIVDRMVDGGLYDMARKFSAVCEIKADHVTVQQLERDKQRLCVTDLWKSAPARRQFYQSCCKTFRQYSVHADTIATFFKKEAEGVSSQSEKASLYQVGIQCIMGSEGDENTGAILHAMYYNMWVCKIQAHIESQQSEDVLEPQSDLFVDYSPPTEHLVSSAKKELMHCGKMPKSTDKPTSLNDQEVSALQALVVELLNNGEVSEACKVTSIFCLYSQDLAIILTCIRLSLLTVSLETLSADMLHLLRTRPGDTHRQSIAAPVALLRNSSTVSLMSNIQPLIDSVSMENEEKISAMECLLNHCSAGRQTCIRILTGFKIAAVLGVGYDDVIAGEDYHILRSLLKTSCQARFRLASDFLATSSLSPEQVAGFLSDAILQSYRVSLGEVTAAHQELMFDPTGNMQDIYPVVRLCQEPSLLGNRLVDAVAAISGDLGQTSDKVLTLQTELLILAHECYTVSCDMEGISNILRAARVLTAHLKDEAEYQLMTRLLTGVGRYNEMTYIFDALQQSHQFELLLGRGMENETKFKAAILDYLKRYHPGDTELYTMVALKFMMYREIAQLLEDNANKLLDKLSKKTLENSPEVLSALQQASQFLSEAAESYIKDNCLRHAQTCVRKARLVALQMKHLPACKQLIHLTRKGASLLIAEHPIFTEAYIVSEAYGQRDHWAAAMCHNVICEGNMKYLQEMRTHVRLTPTLIEESVDRYQQLSEKSPQGPNNIRKLLQYCKDVKIQYRIAKQLGLRDIIGQLEKGDAKSYIIDFSNQAA